MRAHTSVTIFVRTLHWSLLYKIPFFALQRKPKPSPNPPHPELKRTLVRVLPLKVKFSNKTLLIRSLNEQTCPNKLFFFFFFSNVVTTMTACQENRDVYKPTHAAATFSKTKKKMLLTRPKPGLFANISRVICWQLYKKKTVNASVPLWPLNVVQHSK